MHSVVDFDQTRTKGEIVPVRSNSTCPRHVEAVPARDDPECPRNRFEIETGDRHLNLELCLLVPFESGDDESRLPSPG